MNTCIEPNLESTCIEPNIESNLELIKNNKELFKLLNSIDNIEDINMNIFNFFTKYPTNKTIKCPDGSIINMSPDEPSVDKNNNILPVKDGIPQGEEATRMIVKNIDTNVIIASPPGVENTYFITRYGSPLSYTKHLRYDNYEIKRYDGLKKHFPLNMNNPNQCYLHKFNCDSALSKKIIISDIDSDVYSCNKHLSVINALTHINVAYLSDIELFLSDDIIKSIIFTNNVNKLKLLQKVKLTINLAKLGRLLDRQLDSDFVLQGIHYYTRTINYNKTSGWALIYHNKNNKIAHIYLDQISNDIEVIKTIQLFANEIIYAKQYNDIPTIETFFKFFKKIQLTQLERVLKNPYVININHIIKNNMIY
jgi:hypothetical protein